MKKNKILSVIATIVTAIIVVLTAYVVISIVVARVQGREVNLFGYSMSIVLTNSMEPEICVGDMIVYTHCDISEISQGDDIVFIAVDGFSSEIAGNNVVHRVREIISDEEGVKIITYGINNLSDDKAYVTADNFIGICVYHSAALGAFFNFMIKYGVIILIAVIALPFIIKQVIKIIRLSRENEGDKN